MMITPYALFEMMVPHVYNPIDLEKLFGITLSFHVPMLTILMIIGSVPIFFILQFI